MRTGLTAATLLALSCFVVACSSVPEDDGAIASQMRSGGNCTPAEGAVTLPALTATRPRPQPRIDLQGQMSIKLGSLGEQPAKGLSLGFFFSGNNEAGQLDLMTLMGSQMAKVNWEPGQAWLTNDQGRQRYESLDALSADALGEPLPLQALVHWMQGEPDPALPSRPGPGADTFIQQGWLIDTHELAEKKLNARRDASTTQRAVQIKVYLDR